MVRKILLIFAALIVLMLLVIAAAACTSWRLHEQVIEEADEFIYEDLEHVPQSTVVIVPGARVYADGTPSAALEDRLRCALDLYARGRVQRVLVSGDHGQREYDEVNAMHTWLVDRGVLVDDVFLDHAGFRTFDTMVRAAQVFQVESAVVCTQRFHQHRSVYLGRRAGLELVGMVADRRQYARAHADARRETLARVKAGIDVRLPWAGPRYLGEPIPITGEPWDSHDAWTVRD